MGPLFGVKGLRYVDLPMPSAIFNAPNSLLQRSEV